MSRLRGLGVWASRAGRSRLLEPRPLSRLARDGGLMKLLAHAALGEAKTRWTCWAPEVRERRNAGTWGQILVLLGALKTETREDP